MYINFYSKFEYFRDIMYWIKFELLKPVEAKR